MPNPLGPESGQYRVLRGGSWNNDDSCVRSAFRFWDDPAIYGLQHRFSLLPAHHKSKDE